MAVHLKALQEIHRCKGCGRHPVIKTVIGPYSLKTSDIWLWWHVTVGCRTCTKFTFGKHPNKESILHYAVTEWNRNHGKPT